MKIARGLLSEDDYLLTEILFNPRTPKQISDTGGIEYPARYHQRQRLRSDEGVSD